MTYRTMYRFTLAILFMFAATAANAAEECVGLTSKLKSNEGASSFSKAVINAILGYAEGPGCSSLTSVMDVVLHGSKTSGRRLEDKKALNVAQAQANLDKALADPSIGARMEKLKQHAPDEKVRLYLEAAILDEEGYYDARDLRVQQLTEKLK